MLGSWAQDVLCGTSEETTMPKATHMMMAIGAALAAATLLAKGCPRWFPAGNPAVIEESVRVLNHEFTFGARIRRLDDRVDPPDATTCEVTVDTVYVLVLPTTHAAAGVL